MHVVCTKCKGNKKMRVIGGMQANCDKCSGKGYITVVDAVKTEEVEGKKRAGRPKKEKEVA